MNYRKQGKARWVYECSPCGYVYTSVDEFGAYAAEQDHRKNVGHTLKGVTAAFGAVTEAFRGVADRMVPAFKAVQEFVAQLAPAPGEQWQAKFVPERIVTIRDIDLTARTVTYGIERGIAPTHSLPLDRFMNGYQRVES